MDGMNAKGGREMRKIEEVKVGETYQAEYGGSVFRVEKIDGPCAIVKNPFAPGAVPFKLRIDDIKKFWGHYEEGNHVGI